MRRTAALLLLCAACLPRQPLPRTDEGAWAEARDASTRSAKLYDGLATRAFASVVWLSPDVRQARVARVAAWKAMTPEEAGKLAAAERDDAAQADEFLLSLFTPDPADNDPSPRAPLWRLALVVPGEPDRLPQGVELLRADGMLRALYPSIGDFDSVYRIRFARGTPLEGRPFVLRLAGAPGRLEFAWGTPPAP